MSTLIDLATVEVHFEEWEKYVRLDAGDDGPTLDARLQGKIDRAEFKMLEYLPDLTPETISDPLKFIHLIVLTRKYSFDIQHGDASFEEKPQIIRDYEDTIALLERYRDGEFESGAEDEDHPDVKVEAKTRLFGPGGWFRDEVPDTTQTLAS